MRAPALAELHEIFLGQAGGALELVAGKHYRCDSVDHLQRELLRAFRTLSIGFVITFQYVKAARTGGVMSQPPEQKGEALAESTH
jgi:hypothetical protein